MRRPHFLVLSFLPLFAMSCNAIEVQQRHLVVSGGLGCSSLPLRLGSPPEIVVVDLGADGVIA